MPTTGRAIITIKADASNAIEQLLMGMAMSAGASTVLARQIRHTWVTSLDNEGLPCLHCSALDRVINAQAYYRTHQGEDVLVDGDVSCLLRLVARDADSDYPVTIETVAP
jgi:hypothetical protein